MFQITFDQGRTEFTDFSESGTSGAGGDVLFGAGAGDNDDAFGLEGWGQFEGLEDEQPQQQQADGGRGSKRQRTWPADAQVRWAELLGMQLSAQLQLRARGSSFNDVHIGVAAADTHRPLLHCRHRCNACCLV